MGRSPCCDKSKVKRGSWSHEEDVILKNYLNKHGIAGNWITLPQKAGLNRCGKSCRLRWLNYLRPHIKLGGFTEEEDNIIFTLYSTIGSRWSLIAAQLPGRTDNDVKNHWNTKLKKRFLAQNSSTSNNIYTFSNTTSTATTSSDHFSSTLTFQPHVEQTFVFDQKQNTTYFDSYHLDLDQTTINNIHLPIKMESEAFYTGNSLSSSCSTTPTTKEFSSAHFLEEQQNNHNQWFGYDHDDEILHEFVLDDFLNHGPSSG